MQRVGERQRQDFALLFRLARVAQVTQPCGTDAVGILRFEAAFVVEFAVEGGILLPGVFTQPVRAVGIELQFHDCGKIIDAFELFSPIKIDREIILRQLEGVAHLSRAHQEAPRRTIDRNAHLSDSFPAAVDDFIEIACREVEEGIAGGEYRIRDNASLLIIGFGCQKVAIHSANDFPRIVKVEQDCAKVVTPADKGVLDAVDDFQPLCFGLERPGGPILNFS